MTTILLVLILPLLAEGSERAISYPPAQLEPLAGQKGDLVAEVRSILSAKCAACHGVRLTRPKGKFGHVDDLKRLAGDANFVVPLRPDESKLWQVIRDNEMPPKRSKAGPLSVGQKQSIRAWIEAGAKSGAEAEASVVAKPAHDAETEAMAKAAELPYFEHLLTWLGKFHMVVVHFPIALLIVAAIGELWACCCGIRLPTPAVRFCVLCAAAGAVAATGLGWLHAAYSDYAASSSPALFLHRWTGTTAGAVALAVALLSERDARRGKRSSSFRIVLFAGALLVAVAAHLGGTLVYGENFFNW
jgi:uncharacterized membrane protein